MIQQQLDDEDEVETDELIRLLRFAADTIEEQKNNPDKRFITSAKRALRTAVGWAQGIQHHENRRTMPITNGSRRDRRSLPATAIGYRYREEEPKTP